MRAHMRPNDGRVVVVVVAANDQRRRRLIPWPSCAAGAYASVRRISGNISSDINIDIINNIIVIASTTP